MADIRKIQLKLIKAAAELFHRNGFGATTISQILKAANSNSDTLYFHFPTKEDLLIAVLDWYKENLLSEWVDPVFARIPDPIERVFGIIENYRKAMVMTGCQHGSPIGNLTLELADSHPRVQKVLSEYFSRLQDAVSGTLKDAAKRFPAGHDLEALSLFVVANVEGAVLMARAYQSLDPFDTSILQLQDYLNRLAIRTGE